MSARYVVNQPVVLDVTFTVATTPTDPTTVTLLVTAPDGTANTYTYAGSTITRVSAGVFTKTVTANQVGVWSYVWTGTGTAADVEDGTFDVSPVEPRANVYCSLDEVKTWMGLTDTKLDALIDTVRPAASRWVDGRCHRPSGFGITVPTARYYDVADDGLVWTDDIADAATIAIATDTAGNGTYATSWTTNDYQLQPLNAAAGWPEARPYWQIRPINNGLSFPRFTSTYRTGLVRVTAKWGWPEVPAAIRLATIMQTARLTQRRTSPQGVAGFNDFGVVRVSVTDADIDELISDFMLMAYA